MKKELRVTVYKKYGKRCAYCGKPIEYKDMQVDHMYPKRSGGKDDIDNLNPSCRTCNHYKRAFTVEGFRKLMSTLHERIEANYIVRVAIRYGIVAVEPFDGKFYFEKVNEDLAWNREGD